MNSGTHPSMSTMTSTEPCPKKAQLLFLYGEAAAAHASAVTHLRQQLSVMSPGQYDATYRKVELLRMDSRMAQEQLDLHVHQHKC